MSRYKEHRGNARLHSNKSSTLHLNLEMQQHNLTGKIQSNDVKYEAKTPLFNSILHNMFTEIYLNSLSYILIKRLLLKLDFS